MISDNIDGIFPNAWNPPTGVNVCYLDPELEVRLQLEAMQRKTPMAEIIREALPEYLEKRPRKLPPGEGEFDRGLADTADRADEVLAETGFGKSKH